MNYTQALTVAQTAAQAEADRLNEGGGEFVVHRVGEHYPTENTSFVVDLQNTASDELSWEAWASPMPTNKDGVYTVWLRTYGGGRGDSQGRVYVASDIFFDLE